MLWLVLGTIAMVLLIACANVANLLMVRAEGRRQELTVRQRSVPAGGTSRGKLLVERVTLAVLGGALGLAIATAVCGVLAALAPAGLPRLSEVSIAPGRPAFTLGVSVDLRPSSSAWIPIVKYRAPRTGLALSGVSRGRVVGHTRERPSHAERDGRPAGSARRRAPRGVRTE